MKHKVFLAGMSAALLAWGKIAFIFVYFTVSTSAFADSLVDPKVFEQNNTTYNYNQRDISAQIALREALKDVNFYKIRDLHSEKLSLIAKEKLSWWDQMWDGRIKELDRQIKVYKDQNKRYDDDIKTFRKWLK